MQLNEWAARWGIPAPALVELARVFEPPQCVGQASGKEAQAQAAIRLASNGLGLLFRNNSGALKDQTGRLVRYGLGNDSPATNAAFKSSDLVGITPVEIGGLVLGVFTAVEVKAPGWRYRGTDREKAQAFFLNVVQSRGGIATFATGPEDYKNAVQEFKQNVQH